MAESLLCIPLRQSVDVNMVAPLTFLIDNTENSLPKGVKVEEQILEIHKLRTQVVSKRGDNFYSPDVLSMFHRYHDQILALEKKIQTDTIVKFIWSDVFNKGEKYGLPLLSYERINVLFNIGAMQSHLGNQCKNSGSDDDLKMAAKYLNSSAGIYSHLRTICMSSPTLCAKSVDLNPDTLEALSSILLAQAQEIYIAKAIKDQMKDLIIAKLCLHAEEMLGETLGLMTRHSCKHIWEKNWLSIIAGKQKAYFALSQYFQSQACGTQKRFGEQMARLNLFLDSLKIAQDKSQISSLFSNYATEAKRALIEVKKDNDLIYHDQIPDKSDLSSIEKSPNMKLAKITSVPDNFSQDFKDMFELLNPILNIPSPHSFTKKTEDKDKIEEKIPKQTVTSAGDLTSTTKMNSDEPSGSGQTPESRKSEAGGGDEEKSPSWAELVGTSINSIGYYYQLSKEYFNNRDKSSTEKK